MKFPLLPTKLENIRIFEIRAEYIRTSITTPMIVEWIKNNCIRASEKQRYFFMTRKTSINTFISIVIIIFALAIFFYSLVQNQSQDISNSSNVITTTTVTTSTVSGKTGPSYIYPNSDLTPGDIITTATKEQICTSGYSASVRDVPVSVKKQVYEEYGYTYPQPTGDFEADHFISLELGGSNDIKNLWPEPANPKPGFRQKDAVENFLHDQLCSGKETLEQVQNEIRTDWYAVYLRIKS